MDKKRGSNPSEKQKVLLVEFMKKNTQLVSGKFSNCFTFKDAEKRWLELSEILNSMPGAKKDWNSWRKCWHDIKTRTKSKVGIARRHQNETGGGPLEDADISDLEKNVLDIIKPVSVEGHQEVEESMVQFNSSDKVIADEDLPLNVNTLVEKDMNIETINMDIPKRPIRKSPFPQAKTKLKYTAQATERYQEQLVIKNQNKKLYYEKKLKLLEETKNATERLAVAKEKSVAAKELSSLALQNMASAAEVIAEALKKMTNEHI